MVNFPKLNFFKKKNNSDFKNAPSQAELDEVNSNKDNEFPSESNEQPQTTLQYILKSLKEQFKENLLLLLTILAVGIGIGLGFLLRATTNFTPPVRTYFGFPGEVFLRVLKFLILPLVSSSLITGMSGLGNNTGRIAIRSFVFYFISMFSAVVIGLVLVATIRPGYINRSNANSITTSDPLSNRKVSTVDTIFDLIRNLLPDNMVQMCFQLYESTLTPHYVNQTVTINLTNYTNSSKNASSISELVLNNSSNMTINTTVSVIAYYDVTGGSRNGINVLGLVVFCISFGIVVSQMGEKGLIIREFFESVNEAIIRIIRTFMWTSPIGIASLICASVLTMDDPQQTFRSISYYVLTVLVGLAIQGFITLPIMYFICTRKNVFVFFKNMAEALVVALATASSAATLPITFRCVEEKNKIPKMISRFVLPVGAVVNLDGTALYEAVAAIFIAQMNNIEMRFVDYVITSVTATLAACGASGIPSAGLVTMVIVLSALNIPQGQVSLIYAVDWLLDRFRTMINVWGDSIATGSVAHLSRKEIKQHEEEMRNKELQSQTSTTRKNSSFTDIDGHHHQLSDNTQF